MEIKLIHSPEEFISRYDWIKQIDYTDMEPYECLGRCLSGRYSGCIGYKDKAVGIVIYYIYDTDKCWVVGLWAKNNLEGFQKLFYDELKSMGIKTVRSSTTLSDTAYERLMGMKKLWSVYERAL